MWQHHYCITCYSVQLFHTFWSVLKHCQEMSTNVLLHNGTEYAHKNCYILALYHCYVKYNNIFVGWCFSVLLISEWSIVTLFILSQSVIAWIMLLPDASSFETLINYFSFAAWVFYGSTVSALLWLRFRKPELVRPYRVCALPLPPPPPLLLILTFPHPHPLPHCQKFHHHTYSGICLKRQIYVYALDMYTICTCMLDMRQSTHYSVLS